MRNIIILGSLLFSTNVFAVDVDFSKSFVIQETSGINSVSIGGIDAIGNAYQVDFALQEDLTLAITDALVQESASEQLEQSLRNTTWQGQYVIGDNSFSTILSLVVVQDGYVGGEIIHSESVEEGNGYLHARVTGDIVTQFEIDGVFIDEDRIDTEILANLTVDTPNRQLIRIKRMRTLEFRNEVDATWNTNREYRIILEGMVLSGTVGIPNDTVGSNEGTSENGTIVLTQQ